MSGTEFDLAIRTQALRIILEEAFAEGLLSDQDFRRRVISRALQRVDKAKNAADSLLDEDDSQRMIQLRSYIDSIGDDFGQLTKG